MTLERLQPELLGEICSYIDVSSLSLVSKRLRAVALRRILSNLAVTFPGDRYEGISGLLRQSGNCKHVRHLVLKAWKSNDPIWERLTEFLRHLTGLKSLECHEDIALVLVPFLNQLPRCELFVSEFRLGGGTSLANHLAPKLQMLAASCLTCLACDVAMRDLPRGTKVLDYDETEEDSGQSDQDEDGDSEVSGEDADLELDQDILMAQAECSHLIKAVNFLSSIAPNLKRLDLRQNYLHGSIDIPTRRAGRLKLTHLNLSGLEVLERPLLQQLQKITDFENLENLALARMQRTTLAWLDRHPIALPALKQLRMHIDGCTRERCYGESCKYLKRLLLNAPPLRKLEMTGDYNHVLGDCLERHSTLESLALHERIGSDSVIDGIDLDLLKDILRLKSLTSLDIQTQPIRDGTIWKKFHDSKVTMLKLTFEYRMTFEYRRRYHRSSIEDSRELLERAAVDEALARSIFEICGLEYLEVTNVLARSFAFWTADAESNTVKAVLEELAGSYRVTRAEGRIKVVNIGQKKTPIDEDAFMLDSEFMDAFRSLWPSRGGDWRDDWHSSPLIIDG